MARVRKILLIVGVLAVGLVVALILASPIVQRSFFYPKPGGLPPAVSETTEQLLARLQGVLETNAPVVARSLQPGLSDAQISALEAQAGFRLSEDLKATTNDCLAPNLEPHPTNAEFKAILTRMRNEAGVSDCVIPVNEYEEPERELDPYSDRIFFVGTVEEKVIARWAEDLKAEFYREPRPGAELPLTHSKGQPVWD